jgi:CheY-like chemotaxis protein
MLGRLIGEDVALLFEPAADLGRIKADPGQIEQALVSLVVNARDAMPGGGRLVIETANVALDAEYCRIRPDARVGEWVMLGVSDTGPGLDEETRAHLFEPFFSTKHDSRSAGLGLATVYGAVKQNDGFINVYSELGVGTTFKLHFPRVEGTAQPAPRPPARGLPRGNETILLVEDEEMVRELARRVLARQGYVVLSAPCGEDAIGLWRERQSEIALLLTDVIMPRMNGRQLYERLRAERPELRVLYMSGYTENVIAHHGVLDEGARFLPKPFTIEVLARGVREALDE